LRLKVLLLFCSSLLVISLRAISIPIYLQLEYDNEGYVPLILKGTIDIDLLERFGCRILSQTEEFITVRITSEKLPLLAAATDMIIHPAKPDEPLLDQSTSNLMTGNNYVGCHADTVQSAGINGSGVIVGILDFYPLNWKHDDFNTSGWDTDDLRVLYIWNQQDDNGSHPTGFSFGSEYTKADLIADNGPVINSGSHGTGCTGITSGDGSASGAGNPRKGMAPGSDIIYVHKIWDSTGTINAMTYFQNKANELNRPIVISFSGGTKYGFPDGSDDVSQVVDNFCREGRLMAIAGGNYYTTTDHALGTATFGNPSNNISITIDSYTDTGSGEYDDLIESIFFFKQGDNFKITVTDPGLITYETTVLDDDEVFDTDFGRLLINHHDDASIEVIVTDYLGTVTSGDTWLIELAVSDTIFDDEGGNWSAWIYEKNISAHYDTYNTGDRQAVVFTVDQVLDSLMMAGKNQKFQLQPTLIQQTTLDLQLIHHWVEQVELVLTLPEL